MTRTDATFTFEEHDDQSIDRSTLKSNTMEINGDTDQASIIYSGKAFQYIRVLFVRKHFTSLLYINPRFL
jgi:hypothetical protein